MSSPARQLRFLAIAIFGWIGGRAVLLSQAESDAPAPTSIPPRTAPIGDFAPEAAQPPHNPAIAETAAEQRLFSGQKIVPALGRPPAHVAFLSSPSKQPAKAEALAITSYAPPFIAMLAPGASALRPAAIPGEGAASAPQPKRLSGYGWAFVRDSGTAAGLANNGQLGGSQAGFRLDYALGEDLARGFQIGTRISAPLEGKGREAAIGIGWKPGPDIPVTISVERRIGLDQAGRDAFAASVAGGASALALPLKFRLDAYGQAGVVGIKKRDKFIDGSINATRTIIQKDGVSVAAGAGAWGAAQPGVERLDIGPRVRVRLDSGGSSIGVALDWRQRVAGDARPSSGPALTLDGSF